MTRQRIAAFGLLLACTAALAQPARDAQRTAMERLSWMTGQWTGSSVTQGRDGETRSLSTETVRAAASGLALLITGRHYRVLPDGARGEVVHDSAGLLAFDAAAGKYRLSTQLQDGRGGAFEGEMQGTTFSWRLPLEGAHVRYDIVRNERGQWDEAGFYCRDGAQCRPIFRMTLDRQGDAP